MTIAEAREKCKTLARKVTKDALIVAILLFASSASFGLGYLAGRGAGQGQGSGTVPGALSIASSSAEAPFVASEGGTKYYPRACAAASRIAEANRVWFASAADAEAAGYAKAVHCTGF